MSCLSMKPKRFRTGDACQAQSPCPCCGTVQACIVATRDGKTGQSLTTLACDTCGLGRIDPLPSTDELRQWYAQSYRQEYKSAFQPALRHVLRAGRVALDRWHWLQAQGWANPMLGHRLNTLDIGASSGEFVCLMQHLGFDALGLEPHQGYASYASEHLQLNVRQGSVQDLPSLPRDKGWDLVSMFHVLEHLSDPVAALETIARGMSDQGVLFIEVPNATRPCSPHYMFFKAHVLYFTGATLRQTLQAGGWDVLAHNADDEGNLRVLARPRGQAEPQAWPRHAQALVQAQQARRWVPYLLGELRNGRLLERMRSRREERHTAAQFHSGGELLKALYTRTASEQKPRAASLPSSQGWAIEGERIQKY